VIAFPAPEKKRAEVKSRDSDEHCKILHFIQIRKLLNAGLHNGRKAIISRLSEGEDRWYLLSGEFKVFAFQLHKYLKESQTKP